MNAGFMVLWSKVINSNSLNCHHTKLQLSIDLALKLRKKFEIKDGDRKQKKRESYDCKVY